ncbi:MAG: pantoate--beta-alanine ligase [Epsilonproteobacteria bacterium]|nr:pantoate--beta-alanine ligase [Campylobacterota bacterium]
MRKFSDPLALREYRKSCQESVGFVPTMGALHEGHITLIKQSVKENSKTVVSIFVNPTQFLEGEDLEDYPRKIEADLKICELAGVDALFLPTIDAMYEKDELSIIAPKTKGFVLEGFHRPSHFDGVLQVVLKLLNITTPTRAYFGKKDAQQLFMIQNMVKHLFLNVEIVPCEIVRETDGLALSSRNVYLTPKEREKALSLSKSLKYATKMIMNNNKKSEDIKSEMLSILKETQVEYVEIVDHQFNRLKEVEIGNTIILVATFVGTTRLIDNIWI